MTACLLLFRAYKARLAALARAESKASLVFRMMARLSLPIFTFLVLFQAEGAACDTKKSPSAYHCSPVINVSLDGNGQCDCEVNNQLLQEVKDLKKEISTIKKKISQIRPSKL